MTGSSKTTRPDIQIHVLTVSDRAFAGTYTDESGPTAVRTLGVTFDSGSISSSLCADGIESVQSAVLTAARAGAQVVITLGGTGLSPRDLTVEATQGLIGREIPGLAELVRAAGIESNPMAAMSRGVAGVIEAGTHGVDHPVAVVNLAGSPDAAAVGCRVLAPLLPHLVGQLSGTGHAHGHGHVHGLSHGRDAAAAIIEITDAPLDKRRLEASVTEPDLGAVVTFVGRVRNHDPEAEGEVVRLDYSAHPGALDVLEEVVAEFRNDGSNGSPKINISAAHRIGPLAVGDAALIVCVASAHRGDSFELSKNLVEAIKARVPIWKKQFTGADEGVWVGIS